MKSSFPVSVSWTDQCMKSAWLGGRSTGEYWQDQVWNMWAKCCDYSSVNSNLWGKAVFFFINYSPAYMCLLFIKQIFVMPWCHISDFWLSICSHSDSPHSEPGTIDEADNGTEPHTSDEGQYVTAVIFHLFVQYLNNYPMDCHGIWYMHSWSPEDESCRLWWSSDLTSSATSMLLFVVLSEMSWQLDGLSGNLVQIFMFPSG